MPVAVPVRRGSGDFKRLLGRRCPTYGTKPLFDRRVPSLPRAAAGQRAAEGGLFREVVDSNRPRRANGSARDGYGRARRQGLPDGRSRDQAGRGIRSGHEVMARAWSHAAGDASLPACRLRRPDLRHDGHDGQVPERDAPRDLVRVRSSEGLVAEGRPDSPRAQTRRSRNGRIWRKDLSGLWNRGRTHQRHCRLVRRVRPEDRRVAETARCAPSSGSFLGGRQRWPAVSGRRPQHELSRA